MNKIPDQSTPQPGQEYPIANESHYTGKIADRFKRELTRYYASGLTKRMFHPKMHGLVKAEFIVEPDLSPEHRVGIFKEARTFPAWIRFSNAKRHPSADKKIDMRGMAIKLIGVEGEKLLEKDKHALTQDFLLVTSKTLQTKSVKDFQESIYALTGGWLHLLIYALTHPGVIIRSIRQVKRCNNILEVAYFSTTPSRFGSETVAVKYGVFPQQDLVSGFPRDPGDDFLRERLASDLAEKDAFFDFKVQFQEDAVNMPIEDPTREWTSPFVKLATIRIPKQSFDSPEQVAYGEHLSFTPWHSISEHRPLGGANRARKKVYEIISAFRHERNDAPENEPTELKSFDP